MQTRAVRSVAPSCPGRTARILAVVASVILLCGAARGAGAQQAQPGDLVEALQRGGLVLVMRHASAPREAPSPEQARPDNPTLERQLDDAGRQGARAMGEALRALRIPIDAVLTSPTYRARETVRMAGFEQPTLVAELGDGGHSMQGITQEMATWLVRRAAEVPRVGNALLVTHQPNLSRAFPDWGATVTDGETVVIRPDGQGGHRVIARVGLAEWPRLRAATR